MAVPDSRVRGGPPSHLFLLRDALRSAGVDVRTFVYGGRRHDESMPRKVFQRLWDLVALPWRILRVRPDLVHLNSAFDRNGLLRDVFFAPLCKLLGQRVVIKFHGSDDALATTKRWPWRTMVRILVRSCDVVCVLSKEERDTFDRAHPGVRLQVVKNALDLSRYAGDHGFRRRFGIPEHRPVLLFIARFIEAKGIFEVIRALPEIRRRHDVFTAFVGDGPVRGAAESLCRELGVEKDVAFTGYIPEAETVGAYLESSVLVFPTYHIEGMPMVLFHSMACGLPIITTRIRAAADWLKEGEHCLYVPARDVAKLVEAVDRVLDSQALRETMASAGRALVNGFEANKVASEFVELYESTCSRRAVSFWRRRPAANAVNQTGSVAGCDS